MNWGKRILTVVALSGVFASGMVGCAKKSDSNTSGNVNITNQNSVTSTDTVGGPYGNMPVTFTMSTLGGYYGSSYGTVSVMMNQTQQQLPVGSLQNYTTNQINSNSQYAIIATAICADQNSQYIQPTNCAQVAIIAWIQPSATNTMGGYGYAPQFDVTRPAMQVGILKDQNGNIVAASEKVGYAVYMNQQGLQTVAGSPALSSAAALTTWLIQNK